MKQPSAPPCLIVNADDYGYFRCVSRGILDAASAGIVTATGVFATASNLDEQAAWLRTCTELDTGVHLNLTEGAPLTSQMQQRLARWSGRFPRKFALVAAVLSGAITRDDVRVEWAAQIERCLELGLRPQFLNSHEHIHMLPPLYSLATQLASEFGIAHLRFTQARRPAGVALAALFRDTVMLGLEWANRGRRGRAVPRFLGLMESGRLSMDDLQTQCRAMRTGEIYELMCHPGHLDVQEVRDPRLLAYHDWGTEQRTLTSPAARELLQRQGVRLIGYRHLEVRDGRLSIRTGDQLGH